MASTGRACVIGGQGVLGRAVTTELRGAGWEVHPAGRRPGSREGDVRHLDLNRTETLADALRGADLILSTVADPHLSAERWALANGALLVNSSHARGDAAARLAAEASPKPAGTVLLNGGLVPGVANLLAAKLLGRHPEADCLEIAFTVLKDATAGRGGVEFMSAGLAARRHHRIIDLPLPQPFGEVPCIEVHEDGDCGFSGVAGSRRIENYLAFGDRTARLGLRLANFLRLMQCLPIQAFAGSADEQGSPSLEPTAVWVGAKRGERRLGAAIIECDGDYRTTARAARAFAEALMARHRSGCFNPEDLFTLDELDKPLREMGGRIGGPG